MKKIMKHKIILICALLFGCSDSVEQVSYNDDEPCHTGEKGGCACPGLPGGVAECTDGEWSECACGDDDIPWFDHPHDHIVENPERFFEPGMNGIDWPVAERGGAGGMIGFTGGARF